jgi:hypothetical protein
MWDLLDSDNLKLENLRDGRLWKIASLNVALGILFVLINFPKFLVRQIDANVADGGLKAALNLPISAVQYAITLVIGSSPNGFFERVLTIDFALLWVFVFLVVALAVRRSDVPLPALALVGLILGYMAIHIIAWVATIVVAVVGGTLYVVRWILGIVHWIAALVSQLLIDHPLVGLAVVAALLAYAIYRHKQLLRIIAIWAAASVAFVAVILFVQWVWKFLKPYLAPILEFIGWLFGWVVAIVVGTMLAVFAVVVALGALASLGNLALAQIKAGWEAGNGRKGLFAGGFAIGSSFALIALISVASPTVAASFNEAWLASFSLSGLLGSGMSQPVGHQLTDAFALTLPGAVHDFVFAHLTNVKAPAFDSFILVAVLGFANLSIFAKLISPRTSQDGVTSAAFYPKEYVALFGGLLFGLFITVVMVFMQAIAGESTT